MVYFGNSNKFFFKKAMEQNSYFFQAEKKVTKKPPAGNPCGKYLGSAYNKLMKRTKPVHSPAVAHRLATVSQTPQRFKGRNKLW